MGTPDPSPCRIWPAWVLAVLWGIGPALPVLGSGELIGQPYTDLYPAVWGLWEAARQWPAVVTHTSQLAFPSGMGFYFSSPLKGWLAGILVPLIGLPWTWNLLTLAARVATVGLAAYAGRAWGLKTAGCLVVAAAFGCSAVFQGYAVEGIVEGTDGWALALWAWAAGRRRPAAMAGALALCIVTSWYLGAVACLLTVLAMLRDRRAGLGLLGILLAAPALVAFLGAFSGGPPLDPAVRAAMGAPLQLPRPGILPGLSPFAITAYTGFVLLVAAAASRKKWVLLALIPAVLSLGTGPWYELPVLSALRFPYRWHLGTLAILGLAAAHTADRVRWGWAVGPFIVLEALLLSPIEAVLPGAPTEIPALYAQVDAPLVDVPGPVARAPGEINLSRPRARWFLYAQTRHGQPTPWTPDFNAVGASAPKGEAWARAEAALRSFDQVAGGTGSASPPPGLVDDLAQTGVGWLMIHHTAPGLRGASRLKAGLIAQGAEVHDRDAHRWLVKIPARSAAGVDRSLPAGPHAD